MHQSNTSIKLIFFDLGSVLVEVNIEKFYHRMANRLQLRVGQVIEMANTFGPTMREFNLGTISPQEFFRRTLAQSNSITFFEFKDMYVHIFEPIPAMVAMLRWLKNRVRLSLISNTDVLHYEQIYHSYDFMDWFENPIPSYQVRLLKPGPEIFQYALGRVKLRPDETLFIDDKLENVDGARAVGMNGIHFSNAEQLKFDLTKHGLFVTE